jgi:hypothetical protein
VFGGLIAGRFTVKLRAEGFQAAYLDGSNVLVGAISSLFVSALGGQLAA